jgi:hypothetical protein
MGASFDCKVYKNAEGGFAEIVKKFKADQDTDRYENGHSYSGGIGMCSGIKNANQPIFATEKAADDWVSEHAEKWEAALAVQFKNEKGEILWFVGGWCSS